MFTSMRCQMRELGLRSRLARGSARLAELEGNDCALSGYLAIERSFARAIRIMAPVYLDLFHSGMSPGKAVGPFQRRRDLGFSYCRFCEGDGWVGAEWASEPCEHCKGTGYNPKEDQ